MAVPWPSHNRTAWIFVAFGLALRLWHYAVNHTIWYDEAVLLANILDKDYAGLSGPLNHAVAAPPIFLWGLKLLADICGDEPYCWRFVSFACSCGTLLLTVPLVRRVLSPTVAVIAVGLVAISDNHIWLGCNIKPYAGDALIATALLYYYFATQRWSAVKRSAMLALLIPPILCTSYPAAFIIGGLLLALAFGYHARSLAWRQVSNLSTSDVSAAAVGQSHFELSWRQVGNLSPRKRGVVMWAVASLSAMVTFAGLYFGPIRNQRVEGLLNEWGPKFPDFQSPASLPWWLIETTTTVFQFCYNPIGFYLAVVAPFGIVSAWRSGRRDLVVLLTAPFALAVVAAALKAYPYGFNRLMFFIAPCALLLGGLGMDAIFRYLPSKRLHIATGALLLAIGSLLPALHVVKPWDRPDSSGMAAYIRAHRLEGDRVAADEQTYAYFFRGELLSLNEAAATIPPGGRVWVPMDFYTPDVRIAYLESKLKPGEFELIGEWRFRDCCAYLFVRRR